MSNFSANENLLIDINFDELARGLEARSKIRGDSQKVSESDQPSDHPQQGSSAQIDFVQSYTGKGKLLDIVA